MPIAQSRRLRFVELRCLPLLEVHTAGRMGFRALDIGRKPVLAMLYAGWTRENWLLGDKRVQEAEDGKGNKTGNGRWTDVEGKRQPRFRF